MISQPNISAATTSSASRGAPVARRNEGPSPGVRASTSMPLRGREQQPGHSAPRRPTRTSDAPRKPRRELSLPRNGIENITTAGTSAIVRSASSSRAPLQRARSFHSTNRNDASTKANRVSTPRVPLQRARSFRSTNWQEFAGDATESLAPANDRKLKQPQRSVSVGPLRGIQRTRSERTTRSSGRPVEGVMPQAQGHGTPHRESAPTLHVPRANSGKMSIAAVCAALRSRDREEDSTLLAPQGSSGAPQRPRRSSSPSRNLARNKSAKARSIASPTSAPLRRARSLHSNTAFRGASSTEKPQGTNAAPRIPKRSSSPPRHTLVTDRNNSGPPLRRTQTCPSAHSHSRDAFKLAHAPSKNEESFATWPWMLNEDLALAKVSPCPDGSDERPVVADLIKNHRAAIDEIKLGLLGRTLYEPGKHDDLWVLRFWLSHKSVKPAIDAATKTLQFRRELGLDLWDIRNYAPTDCKPGTMVHEYLQYWEKDTLDFVLPGPQNPQGPKFFIKLAGRDQAQMTKNLAEDYWLAFYGHCAEWCFQWADYLTRTSGRLTKCDGLLDAQGITMGSFNAECTLRDGKALGIIQDCYPQTIESVKVGNPPKILRFVWPMVRAVLPKSAVARVDTCANSDKNKTEEEPQRMSESLGRIDPPSVPRAA